MIHDIFKRLENNKQLSLLSSSSLVYLHGIPLDFRISEEIEPHIVVGKLDLRKCGWDYYSISGDEYGFLVMNAELRVIKTKECALEGVSGKTIFIQRFFNPWQTRIYCGTHAEIALRNNHVSEKDIQEIVDLSKKLKC